MDENMISEQVQGPYGLFYQKLGLDATDNVILSLVQKNQNMSQELIAGQIHMSQPSVGSRIKKLNEKGILSRIYGTNLKIADLSLAKIDVNSSDRITLMDELKESPNFVNALITSGTYNLCIFLTASNLRELDSVINQLLRKNPLVRRMEANIVISSEKDFVMPINFMQSVCDAPVVRKMVAVVECIAQNYKKKEPAMGAQVV